MGCILKDYLFYEPTTDVDYIHEIKNDKANSIYYIGAPNNPSMPATMSNKDTNIIRATTFNASNVSGVYIPEGITEIE